MLEHRLCLIKEASVLERGDEVSNAFPLNTYVGSKDIIGDCEQTRNDDVGATVQKGGERGAEFADVDNNAGRLSGGSKAPTAGNACIHCTKELFLGIRRRNAVERNGYGHVLQLFQRLASQDYDGESCIPPFL